MSDRINGATNEGIRITQELDASTGLRVGSHADVGCQDGIQDSDSSAIALRVCQIPPNGHPIADCGTKSAAWRAQRSLTGTGSVELHSGRPPRTSRHWLSCFRFYLEPSFDRTWNLGDITPA